MLPSAFGAFANVLMIWLLLNVGHVARCPELGAGIRDLPVVAGNSAKKLGGELPVPVTRYCPRPWHKNENYP